MSDEVYEAVRPLVTGGIAPKILINSGEKAVRLYNEYLTFSLRSPQTRSVYTSALTQFFKFCDERKVNQVRDISAAHVRAYLDHRTLDLGYISGARVHYSAIIGLIRYYIERGYIGPEGNIILRYNFIKTQSGRTSVLTASEVCDLLKSLNDTRNNTLRLSRDRALICVMLHTFARIGGVLSCKLSDYRRDGGDYWLDMIEKGAKSHSVILPRPARIALDKYIHHGNVIKGDAPLFQSICRDRTRLSGRVLNYKNARKSIRRRVFEAGIRRHITTHSMRATGITLFLERGGLLEDAKIIANHSHISTTMCYDRRDKKRMIKIMREISY